jgi:FtsZ-binding cell division protein ZapB
MGEAKRRAAERITAIQATPNYCKRTTEALTQAYEKLAANYHELEQAVADRVQVSRDALQNWQDETRALMQQISQLARLATA